MRSFLLGFFCVLCGSCLAASKPVVLVSVPPLKYLVYQLAGELVEAQSLVPASANPHVYSPTPRQMATASKAKIWFRIGEGFETHVADALRHSSPDLIEVSVLQGLDLIETTCPHCGDGADPHVWLSLALDQQIAQTMAKSLKQLLPASSDAIDRNEKSLKIKFQQLTKELQQKLAPLQGDVILTSHASLGYFCRDFGLNQLSLEQEGKEPTGRQLTMILQRARALPVRVVVLQAQHNNKGAEMVAKQLDLPTCTINPLAEDIPSTLTHLADCIAHGS